jgi:hypothetical protein
VRDISHDGYRIQKNGGAMANGVHGSYGRILLEVEISPKSLESFRTRYRGITGRAPRIGQFLQVQDNKWGAECRAYFDTDAGTFRRLRRRGFHIEQRQGRGYRGDYEYRINSQAFFWELIGHGYRLGPN